MDQKFWFLNRIILHKCQAVHRDFDERNQVYSFSEKSVYISLKIMMNSTLYKSIKIKILMQRAKSILLKANSSVGVENNQLRP